jgi:hypothetical protein
MYGVHGVVPQYLTCKWTRTPCLKFNFVWTHLVQLSVEPIRDRNIPLSEMKRIIILAIALFGIVIAFLLGRRPVSSPSIVAAPPTNGMESEVEVDLKAVSARQLSTLQPTRAARNNTNESSGTNLLSRLLKGEEAPSITREQAEAFANANGRRADALLAAWRASGLVSFLREAMEKYPQDPHVAYMAWCKANALDTAVSGDTARAERLQKFKEAAPDNAVANYLSARERFKAGDIQAAMRDLAAAEHKPWRDYTLDAIQNTEEAYRSAGFSEAEAKAIAMMGALLPHLSELRGVGKSLNELAATQRQAGDTPSADAALQWSLQLGQRTEQEGTMTLIQQLVGIAIERDTLTKFDPSGAVDGAGKTAQQRIAELDEQRRQIRGVAKDSGEIMGRLNETELAIYFDRMKMFGEQAAMKWAKSRIPAP